MKFKINQKQRLFVIPHGNDGYSCLGFDVCEKRTRALHEELLRIYSNYKGTVLAKQVTKKGTYAAYFRYQEMLQLAGSINKTNGYRFSCELEPRLRGLEGKRVEVVSADGTKRRFYVGKSTGFIPVYLEIKSRRSSGGEAVSLQESDTVNLV